MNRSTLHPVAALRTLCYPLTSDVLGTSLETLHAHVPTDRMLMPKTVLMRQGLPKPGGLRPAPRTGVQEHGNSAPGPQNAVPHPGVSGTDGGRRGAENVDPRSAINPGQQSTENYEQVLTPFELNFVHYYISLSNFNAADAWKRATEGGNPLFYSTWSGADILARPHVQYAIQRAMYEQKEALRLSSTRVLEEITSLAFLDPADLMDNEGNLKRLEDIPVHARKAIASIEYMESWQGKRRYIKIWDKLKALELLGRHLKMFKDELQVTVSFEDLVRESLKSAPTPDSQVPQPRFGDFIPAPQLPSHAREQTINVNDPDAYPEPEDSQPVTAVPPIVRRRAAASTTPTSSVPASTSAISELDAEILEERPDPPGVVPEYAEPENTDEVSTEQYVEDEL